MKIQKLQTLNLTQFKGIIPDNKSDSIASEKLTSASITDAYGKAQVDLQRVPEDYNAIEKIIDKIIKPKGMKISYHYGDDSIECGRPIAEYTDLNNDDLRIKCLRDKDGFLNKIYTLNQHNNEVKIYNQYGILQTHYNITDMKSLKEYKYHPDDIHNFLRKNRHFLPDYEDEIECCVNNLDNLFKSSSKFSVIEKPTLVYRALQTYLSDEEKQILNTIGAIFEDKSFMSTSLNPEIARGYSHNNNILEITLPKDTKYIDLDPLFNIDKKHWVEDEYLLKRNSKLLITAIDNIKKITKATLLLK